MLQWENDPKPNYVFFFRAILIEVAHSTAAELGKTHPSDLSRSFLPCHKGNQKKTQPMKWFLAPNRLHPKFLATTNMIITKTCLASIIPVVFWHLVLDEKVLKNHWLDSWAIGIPQVRIPSKRFRRVYILVFWMGWGEHDFKKYLGMALKQVPRSNSGMTGLYSMNAINPWELPVSGRATPCRGSPQVVYARYDSVRSIFMP